MKYPYDDSFRKIAMNIPFSGILCKLAHSAQDKMLSKVKIPKNVTIEELTMQGYCGLPFKVKVIIPKDQTNVCMLDIHGGGFGFKAAEYHLLSACEYASKLGCKVYFPDYHLLPEYPYPAAYEDCMAVYEYIASKTDRIIVLGDSAGGALAANVCNSVSEHGWVIPCCQMLIYPVTDNDMNTESMRRYIDTPLWNARNNKKMWSLYLKNIDSASVKKAVPMKNVIPDYLPYTYIETAEFDCLHDEAILYAKKIEKIARMVEVYETKGTIHGYDNAMDSPITKESLRKRVEVMQQCLNTID